VEAKFEKYGPVREARIVRNPVNGESRGFGFVAMKYEEDVDAVRPKKQTSLFVSSSAWCAWYMTA
jgi:RNA recognition motif-containing protein